jgi:hypothetical protein
MVDVCRFGKVYSMIQQPPPKEAAFALVKMLEQNKNPDQQIEIISIC